MPFEGERACDCCAICPLGCWPCWLVRSPGSGGYGDGAQRWLARNALEIALDRPVVIDGTVEVELGTAPMLQLTGLRIDNPSWAEAPTMLRVERAEVQIALRPLLEGVVLLPRIALQG